MNEEKFDVVIIGGGNAGIGVTGPVRRAGLSVAMIESPRLRLRRCGSDVTPAFAYCDL